MAITEKPRQRCAGVSEMRANFEALKNGTLSKQRIDELVSRALALKIRYHLMPAVPPQT